MKILDVGTIIGIILVELLALSFSAAMMALTTFLAWDIVLHPVLGLPALTFGLIFLCAWAFRRSALRPWVRRVCRRDGGRDRRVRVFFHSSAPSSFLTRAPERI